MDKQRLLLVEDDPIALDFLTDVLEHEGYLVTKAVNGLLALETLKSNVPDLIISDVMMPEMNGLDLFRRVQDEERYQDVPFIFLTSLDDGDVTLKLKSLGPDDYLSKPIRPKHLLATVKGKLFRTQKRKEQALKDRDSLKNRIQWTLSHELRTPLTVIQCISELLTNEAKLGETPDYHELLQSLRAQAFQLGYLIENFLLVTRIDSGMEEESHRKGVSDCELNEVVEETTLAFWEKAKSKGVDFQVEVPRDLPKIRVFRPHFAEVLKQLLDNGFKFADPENPHVELRAWQEEGRLKVRVSDNGRGISAEDKHRIFEKLSQLDREVHEQQGSGLGLYIVKKLVEINGGTIDLCSGSGQGAQVELSFPVN